MTFSVAWNIAIALVAGELTPRQLDNRWLSEHADDLANLVERVELRHDFSLTMAAVGQFRLLLPPRLMVQQAGLAGLQHGLARARSHRHLGFGAGSGSAAQHILAAGVKATSAMTWSTRSGRTLSMARLRSMWGATAFWSPDSLGRFSMMFPARVRLELADGPRWSPRLISREGKPVIGLADLYKLPSPSLPIGDRACGRRGRPSQSTRRSQPMMIDSSISSANTDRGRPWPSPEQDAGVPGARRLLSEFESVAMSIETASESEPIITVVSPVIVILIVMASGGVLLRRGRRGTFVLRWLIGDLDCLPG